MWRERKREIIRKIIVLFIFWLLISWDLDWPNLLLGLFFSTLISFFMSTDLLRAHESPPLLLRSHLLVKFVFTLIWEVIKANLIIVKIILDPKLPISPRIIEIPQKLKLPVTQVIWGNSITLTPGTLTVDISDERILVHIIAEEIEKRIRENPVHAVLEEMEKVD